MIQKCTDLLDILLAGRTFFSNVHATPVKLKLIAICRRQPLNERQVITVLILILHVTVGKY